MYPIITDGTGGTDGTRGGGGLPPMLSVFNEDS